MTNRKAIEILKNMKWSITTKFNCVNNSTKALDMAITALEKQEQAVDKPCETCKHWNRVVSEWRCSECYRSSNLEDYWEPHKAEEES